MKKQCAIVLASVIMVPAMQAETLFSDETKEFNVAGRAEVRAKFTDNEFQDLSRIRLNVYGHNALNENITMFGRYEFEAAKTEADSNEVTFNARHLYVGGETNFGSFIYGQQDNAVTYLTNFTDMAETFSGYINEHTVTSADRSNNTFRYTFSTEKLMLQVSATQNANKNADGFGGVIAYQLTSTLELAAGMTSSDQEYGAGNATEKSDTYMLGAKYKSENIWLAANVMSGNISADGIADSDFVAGDLFAAYYFGADNSSIVNISYSYYSADDIEALDTNFIGLEYAYYIHNVALYSSYKIALSDDRADGLLEENELRIGARYSF
ncbi:porin [Psychromonas hadalis]|uniref:porin n=1 Tax=Psychromonas hadalis TaxID=211669 RepID=UPI0003B66DAE|nr:porin [Psychromonas hadalis]